MTTQTKALDAPLKINTQHIIVSLISVATFIFFTTIGLNHEEGEAYGWMSLLPTALVLVFALTTHRTVEALLVAQLLEYFCSIQLKRSSKLSIFR